jgi:UDP-N-acetylmuramoyl-L-alanyl-D-glutamate--2,6-diaminopimelate ligase
MGEIADKLCDVAIVTDDNPRTEDPLRIREQIISGMSKATEIADRKQAIEYAISIMKKDDRVLIAGKGHENYQIYGEKIIEFNDYEVAKNYLNMLKEKF